jgi:hypothetical protein
MKTYKLKYDTSLYPFREIVKTNLKTNTLENLHEVEKYDTLVREKDQSTTWHKRFYRDDLNRFQKLYNTFIKNFIKYEFELDEIIYQKIPTFRVHLKDNQAVGEWHRDRDYNHGKSEINIWLPFTDAYDTNTIWIESEEDKNDFKPYNVSYGEVLVFNGANLIHGNKTNIEHDTRVSVDFRIVNPTEFIPSTKGSINTNTSFDIGGYFQKL